MVYDPCGGWGGRMLGAFACGAVRKYIACEPFTKTFSGLEQMRDFLAENAPKVCNASNLAACAFEVELHQCGSEDFQPALESVDMAFTSPP